MERISRILLIRLRSLGDAILTLPLIEALHHWRPDLKQSVLIEAPYAPVFLGHPAVDEVLILQNNKGFKSGGWTRLRGFLEIRNRRFSAVLNLHGGTTSMLFMIASGARLRLGQESHRGSRLYTHRIPSSNSIWQRRTLHTVEHQLSAIRWMGIPIPPQSPKLYVDAAARVRIRNRLKDAGISDYVLIQPTATLETKQWQAENFAQLGDWMGTHHRIPVIYTAAPHEISILQQISKATGERHTYWSDLPLTDLFALVEGCQLFVGCDSGPTHAAAALKKPIVVVWGSSSFEAWHPWGTDFVAVRSELPCMPCPGYDCKEFDRPRCIREVSVSRVKDACNAMLDPGRNPNSGA
jgi:ADP-heptose:LPS heptosyltransferase